MTQNSDESGFSCTCITTKSNIATLLIISFVPIDEFFNDLFKNSVDALDEYDLTGPEKLAVATRDISWIEGQIGHLTRPQKRWLELKRIDDIW